MAGNTNFPTGLDDDTSLLNVTDGSSTILAAHHNNLKEAIKAVEAKLGIYSGSVPTSIDYRLGNPTGGHKHDGASGQGPQVSASNISGLSGTYIASLNATVIVIPDPNPNGINLNRVVVPFYYTGTIASGPSLGMPFSFGRTMQVENVSLRVRVGQVSGATLAFDINVGPTSLWQASQQARPQFSVGGTYYGDASPNLVTYPSGAEITVDVDGANQAARDLSILFTFKE